MTKEDEIPTRDPGGVLDPTRTPPRIANDGATSHSPETATGDDDSDTKSVAASIGNQREPLPKSRLLIAFPTLCTALFVSFFDQTSVSTSIPAISADLATGQATSWIGGSFLISSTAFQLFGPRLSDLFGRKNVLLASLALLGFGDLLCGFAKTAAQLFAFRAVAGIGGGGVTSIVLIIVSDITTLENRGKYQGKFHCQGRLLCGASQGSVIVSDHLCSPVFRNHRRSSRRSEWHRPLHWGCCH